MKQILLALLLPATIQTANQNLSIDGSPSDMTLTFNIHLSNLQDNIPQTTLVSSVQQTATQIAMPIVASSADSASSCGLGTWLLGITGAGILSAYGYLCYTIIRGNYYLGRTDLWSSCRADLSFDEFLAIPQQDLAQQLVQEINRRYYTSRSITDFLVPLATFTQRIEDELQMLNHYYALYHKLSVLKLIRLFPANHTRYAHAQELIQRATYIQNIIRTWSSQYAFEQAENRKRSIPEYEGISQEKRIARRMKKRDKQLLQIIRIRERLHGMPNM